jgi:hypothetical protein
MKVLDVFLRMAELNSRFKLNIVIRRSDNNAIMGSLLYRIRAHMDSTRVSSSINSHDFIENWWKKGIILVYDKQTQFIAGAFLCFKSVILTTYMEKSCLKLYWWSGISVSFYSCDICELNINAEKYEDFDEELKVMEMVDTPEWNGMSFGSQASLKFDLIKFK